ncbi:MAG: hypothetical protein JST68_12125 [Bacteroidetes bacterium]|nr:hypothetical protein [Bacteroidota bacterium]
MERAPARRRNNFLLVTLILLVSILLEQFLLIRLVPQLGQLGSVQPMIIFLDIPLRLPTIDWLPVSMIFVFFYLVVITPELSHYRNTPGQYFGPSRGQLLRRQGWGVFTAWWVLLIFIAMTGGLYYLIEEQLPRVVRNGIDSFGIRADIALPYPLEGVLHLHGGMIMLVALILGGRFLLRQARLPLLAQPITETVPQAVEEPAPPVYTPAPAPARPTPEIPAYATASNRVCTHKAYLPPEPVPAVVRPCVVKGVLEPS